MICPGGEIADVIILRPLVQADPQEKVNFSQHGKQSL